MFVLKCLYQYCLTLVMHWLKHFSAPFGSLLTGLLGSTQLLYLKAFAKPSYIHITMSSMPNFEDLLLSHRYGTMCQYLTMRALM